MRQLWIGVWCSAAILVVLPSASGQFWERLSNPQVTVTIKHPPMTGLMLKRAAIGRVTGTCAEEIADKLTNVLTRHMEVVDRANLDAILREQHFSLSEYVDSNTASRLGKILGPTALILIRGNCRESQQPLRQTVRTQEGSRINYISRTTVTLRGSVQVVDLETSRIFQQLPLEITEQRENTSFEGQPEFPLVESVISDATDRAVRLASRLLVPWTHEEKVYFYDDKECNLKAAYEYLRAGQLERVLEISRSNVQACEAASFKNEKDRNKALGKAHYNLGVSLMLTQNFDEAASHFDKVVQLRGSNDIVREAMARNEQLRQAAEAMRKTVERTEQFEEKRAATASPASGWSAPSGTGGSGPAEGGANQAKSGSAASPADRLRNLEKLFKEGLITKEEYDRKRAAILAEM